MDERENIKEVGFTVDSGLINRLGIELVGKAETAVSELIKNAYDADATEVSVEFNNTDSEGGTLIITDNGLGMTEEQLKKGFMRISSSDKVHNPKSIRFGRTRAGKKGIGRFATQRLGKSLSIMTQAETTNQRLQIDIDWSLYKTDTDIEDIKFPLKKSSVTTQESGTQLIIRQLRDKWTKSSIEKIFDYVNSLFQPNYLSERSEVSKIAIKDEQSFKVVFRKDGEKVNNHQEDFLDKALAVIEGYIGDDHKGLVSVQKQSLKEELNELLEVKYKANDVEICTFPLLKNVKFKVYYFIYDRPEFYEGGLIKKDFDQIKRLSNGASGIKLYRNGFRVLPFGEPEDDWTNINQRWSMVSGSTNIPFRTTNLFGFVELLDNDKKNIFEETSSREGLIVNEAFIQLRNFVHYALRIAKKPISEKIFILRKKLTKEKFSTDITQYSEERETSSREFVESLQKTFNSEIENNPSYNKEEKAFRINELALKINQLYDLIDENEMLRVLAGLGLILGEYVHEIKQNKAAINSLIYSIQQQDEDFADSIVRLKKCLQELFSYNNYFSTTISQNTSRENVSIDMRMVVNSFTKMMSNDFKNNNIKIQTSFSGGLLKTIPMHPSIWTTVLQNLYSNSKKAIKHNFSDGMILIEVFEQDSKVVLRFNDNGCGINEENKQRVFNAFYSTTTADGFNASYEEQLIGTGLGLKIVKDMIVSNKGTIEVVEPTVGYNTCFEIKIDKN